MRESVKYFNGKLFPYDFGTRLGMVDFCTSSILEKKHLGPTPHALAYQVFRKGREIAQLDFDVIFNRMGIDVSSYLGFKEGSKFGLNCISVPFLYHLNFLFFHFLPLI